MPVASNEPFWQYINGHKKYDEKFPTPGYSEKYDLRETSSWGGYAGLQAKVLGGLARIEVPLTDDDRVISVGLVWLIGGAR